MRLLCFSGKTPPNLVWVLRCSTCTMIFVVVHAQILRPTAPQQSDGPSNSVCLKHKPYVSRWTASQRFEHTPPVRRLHPRERDRKVQYPSPERRVHELRCAL